MPAHALRWFGAGKCLVDEDGETFTAARVIPGEVVTLQRYERGGRRVPVADQIVSASPHRVAPACPHYDRCTGCDLLHVSPDEEARYKQLTIREVLQRFAGLTIDQVAFVGGTARGAHRVRARFRVQWVQGQPRLGLSGFAGTVVDIPNCWANDARISAVYADISSRLVPFWKQEDTRTPAIEVCVGANGIGVAWYDDVLTDEEAAIVREIPGVIGVRCGDRAWGDWPAQAPVGTLQLAPAFGAWTQPTPERAAALYAWVRAFGWHRDRRVLDATCGTGGLTFTLAQDATEVVAVDANWAAVESAKSSEERLRARGHNMAPIHFRGGKIETVAARLLADGERFGTVIVNPMRRSLGDVCMQTLAQLCDVLIMLAPAPRAGAEDVKALVAAGFEVTDVAAVNLHPGTGKVMMGVVLKRPTSSGRGPCT